MALAYKFFKTSEDFEKWQNEEKLQNNHKLAQVSPLPFNLEAASTGALGCEYMNADLSIGVFVLYEKGL